MKKLTKMFAMVLALSMVIGMFSVNVYAADIEKICDLYVDTASESFADGYNETTTDFNSSVYYEYTKYNDVDAFIGDGYKMVLSKVSENTWCSVDNNKTGNNRYARFETTHRRAFLKSSNTGFITLKMVVDDSDYSYLKEVTASGRNAYRDGGTEAVRFAISADETSYYEIGVAGKDVSTRSGAIKRHTPYILKSLNGVRTLIANDSEMIMGSKWEDNANLYTITVNDNGFTYTLNHADGRKFEGTYTDADGLINSFKYPMALAGSGGEVQFTSAGVKLDYGRTTSFFTEDWSYTKYVTSNNNCLDFNKADGFGVNQLYVKDNRGAKFAWGDNYSWYISDKSYGGTEDYVYTNDWTPGRLAIKDSGGRTIINLKHDDAGKMNIKSINVNSLYSNTKEQEIRIAVNDEENTYYRFGVYGSDNLYGGEAVNRKPFVSKVVNGAETRLALGTVEFNKWARTHYEVKVDGSQISFKIYQTNNGGSLAPAEDETLAYTHTDEDDILKGFEYPLALAGRGNAEIQFEGISLGYSYSVYPIESENSIKVMLDTAGMKLTDTPYVIFATYAGQGVLDSVMIEPAKTGKSMYNFAKSAVPGAFYKVFVIDGAVENMKPAVSATIIQ